MQNVDVLLSTTQSAAWGGEQEEEEDRIATATWREGISTGESRRSQSPHGSIETVREDANESERQFGRDRPPDSKVWFDFFSVFSATDVFMHESTIKVVMALVEASHARFRRLSQQHDEHYHHLEYRQIRLYLRFARWKKSKARIRLFIGCRRRRLKSHSCASLSRYWSPKSWRRQEAIQFNF